MENNDIKLNTYLPPPANWHEWVQRWNESNDPFFKQALLQHGPAMKNAHQEVGRDEAMIIYLETATDWYRERGNLPDRLTIIHNPKHALAKTAFDTLCGDGFLTSTHDEILKSISYFVFSDEVMDALITFLGSNDIKALGNKDDRFAANFSYASEEQKTILGRFCFELAVFIVDTLYRFRIMEKPEMTEHQLAMRARLEKYQQSVMKILIYLQKIDTIVGNATKLSDDAVAAMRMYLLGRRYATTDTFTEWKSLTEVADIFKIVPPSERWNLNKQNVTLCYIYEGIVQQRKASALV